MELFFCWVFLSAAVAVWAYHRGRDHWGFFFLSFFLSPAIGLAALGTRSRNERRLEERAVREGDFKKCYMCAELVRHDAARCRYCGADLSPADPR